MRLAILATALLAASACTDDKYLVITVDARPSVHGATAIAITETNSGTMRTDTLQLAGKPFPVTFSVTAPGRTGALDLDIKALDENGLVVGTGSGTTPIDAATASVSIDPADFVVNTDFGQDQFLTTDFETVGYQAAVASDFSWTVSFRTTCSGSCDILARRFDKTGQPLMTAAAAGTNQFQVSATPTQTGAFPAIASTAMNTIAVWDFTDVTGGGHGIACRSIDATGALGAGQLALSTDAADTATIAPIGNGTFAVAWQIYTPANTIRTIFSKPDCNPIAGMTSPGVSVSTAVGSLNGPHRTAIASNGNSVLFGWITDDAVHLRQFNLIGQPVAAEFTLFTPPAGQLVEAVRIAPMGSGFAVVARLAASNNTSPGSIVLFRTIETGQTVTGSTMVTITDKSGSDFSTGHQGFGVATRADGTTLVVWHQCDDGSAQSCDGNLDVYGRVVHSDGTLPGDPFVIPTTLVGNQINPSVVALDDAFAVVWNDASKAMPDVDGSAVRARVIYPP